MNRKMQVFFKEKQLDSRIYEIEHEGTLHLMESEVVIDFLINLSDKAAAKKIYEKIVYIDFRNGDFHDFLKYCGKGIVEMTA